MKLASLSALALFTTSMAANAVIYATDFNSGSGYSFGNIDTQNGWVVSDSGTLASGSILTSFLLGEGRAAYLGDSEITTGTVTLSRSVNYALGGSTFNVDFGIQDSSNDLPQRDTFGFFFENAAGDNLFSLVLIPVSPNEVNPEGTLAIHNLDWSSENVGQTASPYAIVEGAGWNINIEFLTSGADLLFNASLNGDDFSGVLTGMAGETVTEFGAFWTPTTFGGAAGDSSLGFDNVSIIPEPSAALLALLGAIAGFRRRRA